MRKKHDLDIICTTSILRNRKKNLLPVNIFKVKKRFWKDISILIKFLCLKIGSDLICSYKRDILNPRHLNTCYLKYKIIYAVFKSAKY